MEEVVCGRPGWPVSRVLYPDKIGTVAIYLAPRLSPEPLACKQGRGAALPPWSCSQPGDEPGAHSPSIRPCSRWGLAAAASPQSAGRSYRPISPLPRFEILRCAQNDIRIGAVCFCATFRPPRRTNPLRKPGRYPAPCPVEPGLSSPIGTSLDKLRMEQPGRPPGQQSLLGQSSIGVWGGQLDMRHGDTYQIAVRSNTKPGSTGSPDTISGSSRTSTSWPGR